MPGGEVYSHTLESGMVVSGTVEDFMQECPVGRGMPPHLARAMLNMEAEGAALREEEAARAETEERNTEPTTPEPASVETTRRDTRERDDATPEQTALSEDRLHELAEVAVVAQVAKEDVPLILEPTPLLPDVLAEEVERAVRQREQDQQLWQHFIEEAVDDVTEPEPIVVAETNSKPVAKTVEPAPVPVTKEQPRVTSVKVEAKEPLVVARVTESVIEPEPAVAVLEAIDELPAPEPLPDSAEGVLEADEPLEEAAAPEVVYFDAVLGEADFDGMDDSLADEVAEFVLPPIEAPPSAMPFEAQLPEAPALVVEALADVAEAVEYVKPEVLEPVVVEFVEVMQTVSEVLEATEITIEELQTTETFEVLVAVVDELLETLEIEIPEEQKQALVAYLVECCNLQAEQEAIDWRWLLFSQLGTHEGKQHATSPFWQRLAVPTHIMLARLALRPPRPRLAQAA